MFGNDTLCGWLIIAGILTVSAISWAVVVYVILTVPV